jgi:DNA-binding response OmpR family regulator
MCQRCQHLAEEVAYLKGELGIQYDEAELRRLQDAFSLPRGPAQFLRVLRNAKGRVVPHLQVLDALPGNDDRSLTLLSVYACRVRNSLGHSALESVRGVGYRLSQSGLALAAQALEACHDQG